MENNKFVGIRSDVVVYVDNISPSGIVFFHSLIEVDDETRKVSSNMEEDVFFKTFEEDKSEIFNSIFDEMFGETEQRNKASLKELVDIEYEEHKRKFYNTESRDEEWSEIWGRSAKSAPSFDDFDISFRINETITFGIQINNVTFSDYIIRKKGKDTIDVYSGPSFYQKILLNKLFGYDPKIQSELNVPSCIAVLNDSEIFEKIKIAIKEDVDKVLSFLSEKKNNIEAKYAGDEDKIEEKLEYAIERAEKIVSDLKIKEKIKKEFDSILGDFNA